MRSILKTLDRLWIVICLKQKIYFGDASIKNSYCHSYCPLYSTLANNIVYYLQLSSIGFVSIEYGYLLNPFPLNNGEIPLFML